MIAATKQSRSRGLSASEVVEARSRSGWNELPRSQAPTALAVFFRQFRGLLIVILFAAAVIAFALGEIIDAVAIGLVLVLNAVLGFVQEWRAETALDALRSMLSPQALVVRDGEEKMIPAREIVPGDRVIVGAGETVLADLRLLESVDVAVDESVMTGESLPVEKQPEGEGDVGRLFAGTALVAGRAEGEVTEIGASTRFGGIAALTAMQNVTETHLQMRLGQLAAQLGAVSIVVAAMVIGLGVWVGRPLFEMFMTGLSLAVAIVPEGLPAVVTVTLALGASAMARRQALVRRLQAVESLGAASVICTDKTGTLTENQMTATRIWTAEADYEVTGTGYDPAGHIAYEGRRVRAEGNAVLAALLETALVCTHAKLTREGPRWQMIGAPTEGALVTLAYKGWALLPDADTRLAEKSFSSERKRMSVLARHADGLALHVKGAPEVLIPLCDRIRTETGERPMSDTDRKAAYDALARMAGGGQRVIALARRQTTDPSDLDEQNLTLLGLVGLIDPPRPEVASAISLAQGAGIRVIMVTGDSALTAASIARDVGLGEPVTIDGAALDAMNDTELSNALKNPVLFARTHPEQKLRIVAALQSADQIVAMTGDGVNDAPALKRADIGVAMGIRGTDVSRGAADLVLLDDNFSTIVGAIAEGRRQFDNVRKFVRYLLCSNAGEVVAIVINLLMGGPLIFLATQILWMNLITDGVTAVALGLEKAEPDQMRRPPHGKDAPLLGAKGLGLILVFGAYTGAASLWLFYTLLPFGVDLARTAAFTGMVVFEKASVFAFRSLTRPNWSIGWLSNPLLFYALTISIGLQVAAVYWQPL